MRSNSELAPRAKSKDERLAPVEAKDTQVQEVAEIAQEEPKEEEPKQDQPVVHTASPSEAQAVQLTGFIGSSSGLNGTFTADGTQVNGKQVYSQGDGSLECLWYHNGAWRVGKYNWLASKDLGRCHAFVKTEADLGDLGADETWMSCLGPAGGDPDGQESSLFQPQMSAKAAKMALDSMMKRGNSKKLTPTASSNRLTNILTDQILWVQATKPKIRDQSPSLPPRVKRKGEELYYDEELVRKIHAEAMARQEQAEVPTAQHRAPTHDAAGEEPGPFRDWKQRRGRVPWRFEGGRSVGTAPRSRQVLSAMVLRAPPSTRPNRAEDLAFPCAAVAFVLKLAQVEEWPKLSEALAHAEMDATVYNAFSTLLGILVVFRTGQAYNRFWDGSTLTHQMRGDWFDAASSIISFTRTGFASEASEV
eukprot:g15507.t2